jgi:hypothetical protein
MQLYSGSSLDFCGDATRSEIAGKLEAAFFEANRYRPRNEEVTSWRNSLLFMAMCLQEARLHEHGIALEYQLPLSAKRLDCIVTGRDSAGQPSAAIIELKQWEDVAESDSEDCVTTWIGGRLRDVLHPSRQVGQYEEYLRDVHSVFASGVVKLSSCAYLHNMRHSATNEIFHPRHDALRASFPVFTADHLSDFVGFLKDRLGGGEGRSVLDTVLLSKYGQSKKLLDHTANVVKDQASYVLLDNQQVVFNKVLGRVRAAARRKLKKTVVLVQGGPGTGKSVIALHLLGRLSAEGLSSLHLTGSKAFTENLKKVVGTRASAQFGYTHFNMKSEVTPNFFDAIIVDEAHRIRSVSANQYTKAADRSGKPQIDEVVDAAKVSVFFIDDLQTVRPGEVGSAQLVRETATKFDAEFLEFELESQFRCGGSDGYINWIDNTLGIRPTDNVIRQADDPYEFKICGSPAELEKLIRSKDVPGQTTARLTAGFCWPWSDPIADGTLVRDVTVGGWTYPWNAKPDAGRLARGVPKSNFWASDSGGLDQVGCIYTAQGFEFDYVGVIFGDDLKFDWETKEWIGDRQKSFDKKVKASKDRFVDLVKNTYRVLLTRGIKGCYVCFVDDGTRRFFESCMEQARTVS